MRLALTLLIPAVARFDDVWQGGDLVSPPAHGVQAVPIAAGGAAIVAIHPGGLVVRPSGASRSMDRLNVMLDHAPSCLRRGALGVLEATP